MEITKVVIEKRVKLYIRSIEIIYIDDIVKFMYNGMYRYFKVYRIETDKEVLLVECIETGYSDMIAESKEFDPRELIGYKLEKVTSKDEIRKIHLRGRLVV